GGSTGSDIPFRWNDVEYGQKFLTKLWNASRFSLLQLHDYEKKSLPPKLETLDRWILSKLEMTTRKVSNALENFQFNNALEELRHFTWHIFCDQYLEAVKYRLYKPEVYGKEARIAAQYAIFESINRILLLLAPFCPHITDELYQYICASNKRESIHQLSWPHPNESLIDVVSEKKGDLVIAVISEIRRLKAERNIPLNATIKALTLASENNGILEILKELANDIKGICKIDDLMFISKKLGPRIVEGYPEITVSID
ncbi:MAG: class I tRNA ligase family protein, partial [Candidatus Bathyarchaeia archaeon]